MEQKPTAHRRLPTADCPLPTAHRPPPATDCLPPASEWRMGDHERFMAEAIGLASQALDAGEFPVGCVIVDESGRIVAVGRRLHSTGPCPNELDHAEILALRALEAKGKSACNRSRLWVYSTLEPCLMCLGALLIGGIRHIAYAYEDAMGGACRFDLHGLSPLYTDHPVTIIPGVLRTPSLRLFQSYFRNPANSYWQGSLLATYTLNCPDEPDGLNRS